MPTSTTNPSVGTSFLYIVIALVFAGLLVAGLLLIGQSNQMYKDSKDVTEKMLTAKAAAIVQPSYTAVKDGYAQALLFFTLALGALLIGLLLPRIQNLSISPVTGITLQLKELQQNVDNVIKQANTAQEVSVGSGGIKPEALRALTAEKKSAILPADESKGSLDETDPQKNQWGGEAEKDGRRLSASVSKSSYPGYYEVLLKIESFGDYPPLSGLATFHLHPTFRNPDPVVVVNDGKAILHLKKVYGAFTVGAEVDQGGKTKLELDLAELAKAPKEFREK